MTPTDLVTATRALLATVRPAHLRHLVVVVDDDGPRLEQRSAFEVWLRCNDLAPIARQLTAWRRPTDVPVFVVGDDIAELRGFAFEERNHA